MSAKTFRVTLILNINKADAREIKENKGKDQSKPRAKLRMDRTSDKS